jgi:hypothetical protein
LNDFSFNSSVKTEKLTVFNDVWWRPRDILHITPDYVNISEVTKCYITVGIMKSIASFCFQCFPMPCMVGREVAGAVE